MSTPLMNQYFEVRKRFLNCIIFFHLGDFYEMFDEDAVFMSQNLGLTLTKRGDHPMCGIPVANIDFYLKKLVSISKKPIAICEQIETPEQAKENGRSLVTRDVTKIITKGTYADPLAQDNNFILSIVEKIDYFSLCYADLSSGECFVDQIEKNLLIAEIYRINPSEIILCKEIEILQVFEDISNKIDIEILDQDLDQDAYYLLEKYLAQNLIKVDLNPKKYNHQLFMRFAKNTLKNLEILVDSTGETKNSLFNILNKTQTAEGKRILKNNLVRPLTQRNKIEQRLNATEYFINHIQKKGFVKFMQGDLLKMINNIASPKILRKICEILEYGEKLNKLLENKPDVLNSINPFNESLNIYKEVLQNINEDPGDLGSGNCFKDINEVHELNMKKNAILEEMFLLPNKYNLNCKIKNNNLIGFFFEFTKNQKPPEDFILKQGLATSSRYSNPVLMKLEIDLKNIENDLLEIEYILFDKFKNKILKTKKEIENVAKYLGYLDYFHSCAQNAIEYKYFRPQFTDENILDIKNGRHPVLERIQPIFIHNNLNLNNNLTEILITGPNMGGKSTYLRQNALIIIMAHVGMFVPANMVTKVFDGVFVRIGSGDNLSQRESTFMLEMKECAEIIELSTKNSFIVLDEVGRGTSTNDGMSICYAILEYIHDLLGSFAIISTHYNELSSCSEYLSRFKNFKVNISFKNEQITFLYKIVEGIAEGSFGIHVAEKANLPQQIILRSKEIFNKLQ